MIARGGIGTAIIVAVIWWLLSGYVFMMTVGAIHGWWIHQLPTIGYLPACCVSFLLVLLVNILRFDWDVKSE